MRRFLLVLVVIGAALAISVPVVFASVSKPCNGGYKLVSAKPTTMQYDKNKDGFICKSSSNGSYTDDNFFV